MLRMLVHAAGLQPMPGAGPPPASLAPAAVLGACRGLQAPTQVGWWGLDHTAPSWHEGGGGVGSLKSARWDNRSGLVTPGFHRHV